MKDRGRLFRPSDMQVLALLLLLCWSSALSAGQLMNKRLVCYYTSWARYRTPLAQFTPQNINPHLCTHLHYAIVNSNDKQKLGPADPHSDLTLKGYEQIVALKEINPALKVLIMLGGSNSLQQPTFEDMVGDEAKIDRFVSEAIKYIRMHNFDGIDIDWKVSGKKDGHAKLMEALAAGFKREADASGQDRLLLSTTIPSNATKIVNDFDVARIDKAVDYVNALLYQFHSSSRNVTGHHAPLFATDPDTTAYVDFVVQTYKESGADLSRLNLAVPTFGIAFTLSNPDVRGFGAPALDAGHAGKLTKSKDSLSFTEICEHVSMHGWVASRPHPDSVGPYAVKDDQWVAYDDEFMMRRKGAYIREKGLGGAAVWNLDYDDFRGFCTGRHFPLIEALKMGLFEDGMVVTTTPSPPTTPAFDNAAVFSCPSNGRFPKADDCKKFYACEDGLAKATDCEPGTSFDVEKGFCTEGAMCMEEEIAPVSGFASTQRPATPMRPIRPTQQPTIEQQQTPTTVSPRPPSVPLPLTTMVPPLLIKTNDAVVVSAAEKPTRNSETKLDMDMDVKDDGELQQLLDVIQRLGGVNSVQRLLEAVDKPQPAPVAPAQPGLQSVVTTEGGKTKIRVRVTVEVEPF